MSGVCLVCCVCLLCVVCRFGVICVNVCNYACERVYPLHSMCGLQRLNVRTLQSVCCVVGYMQIHVQACVRYIYQHRIVPIHVHTYIRTYVHVHAYTYAISKLLDRYHNIVGGEPEQVYCAACIC